jgi:predicted DNA-binding protein (MmcQ/YjbR family)
MKYLWIEDYLMSKKGAIRDFKVEWQWHRFLIMNKMFAVICIDNIGKDIITLKCDLSLGSTLRNQYISIKPGYYMNKNHWNSLDLNGNVPDQVLKSMIDQSYQLIFSSLSKTIQNKIIGG